MKLGIDIGSVLAEPITRATVQERQAVHPVRGAFSTVTNLAAAVFGGDNICIVSKIPEHMEPISTTWLESHNFFELTGMPCAHLYFCRERADKAPICEAFGVTHFVDDRAEVLSHMHSVANRYLLTLHREPSAHEDISQFVRCPTWQHVQEHILSTI